MNGNAFRHVASPNYRPKHLMAVFKVDNDLINQKLDTNDDGTKSDAKERYIHMATDNMKLGKWTKANRNYSKSIGSKLPRIWSEKMLKIRGSEHGRLLLANGRKNLDGYIHEVR